MPLKRYEWNSRIKSVELESRIAKLAIDRLLDEASTLAKEFQFKDIRNAARLLEGTYLMRLFAEFETGLRSYWKTIKTSQPKTRDLIDGLGSRLKISYHLINGVHSVREHRNSLIHERDESIEPIPMAIARDYLCEFFYRLPPDW